MSIQWLPFNIKTAPKEKSLLLFGKVEIESDDSILPDYYFEGSIGVITEEDGRLVINFDNMFDDFFNPTHYAEINWPDD